MMFDPKGVPTGPVFGVFCAGAAVLMGFQMFQGFREGWAYNGRTSRVYKKDQPTKYFIWLSVQMVFVIFLSAMAIYSFVAPFFS